MKAIVSAEGVVTIPKSLREQMGIRPGFVVDFAARDGRLIGVVLDPSDPIDAMFGAFPCRNRPANVSRNSAVQ